MVTSGVLACGLEAKMPSGPSPPPAAPTLQVVAQGLTSPLFLTSPPGDSARLFIVQQDGRIRIIRNDTLLPTPFLDIGTRVRAGGEQGLLGLAFHPSYKQNGRFYVDYTDVNGNTRVVRFTVSADPNVADPASGDTVLAVAQPFANHNGGMLLFGPDGYLYVGLGDGGSGGDPFGNGQNRHVLLGKILRLDVDHGSPYTIPAGNPFAADTAALGAGEIWDYGLRNPWRFSFDRATGDLYIGDVGEGLYEEVDVEQSGGGGGVNYGWNVMEGLHCYNATSCTMTGLTPPVLEYSHAGGPCSVIGGYVYRGNRLPVLAGQYLYADYCSGWVRSFHYALGRAGNLQDWSVQLPTGTYVSSFGEDARGELYVINLGGKVYRIVPAS